METLRQPFRQTDKYQRGHSGEQMVAKLLQDRGWFVIPSYDYSGEDNDKAPRLQGNLRAYVIPDLDIARGGRRIWAEVKTKACATYTRITQRFEHGIPMRHFRDYRAVQDITGCSVWLFVYEENTGEVLCGELDNLAAHKREYTGGKMSYGGMVFFPRDAFTLLAKLEIKSGATEVGL